MRLAASKLPPLVLLGLERVLALGQVLELVPVLALELVPVLELALEQVLEPALEQVLELVRHNQQQPNHRPVPPS